jgi:hypothetical protein
MTRIAPAIPILLALLAAFPTMASDHVSKSKNEAPASAPANDQSGFEPVDPASLDTVSGKRLLIAAYSVILGALALYSLLLLLRSRSVSQAIDRLEQQLGTSPTKPSRRP